MTDMKYTPSFITYESLIMMYGFCDYASRARDIFNGIVDFGKEMKVSTLNAMLEVYCINGLPMKADKLFDNVYDVGVILDSLTYKLLPLLKMQQWLPDEEAGEIPATFVVMNPNAKESETDIMDFVDFNVACYMKVRFLQLVDTIPKSP